MNPHNSLAPAPPYLIMRAFSSFLTCVLCSKRIELMTSVILSSSERDSSIMLPGSVSVYTLPACCSRNLNASFIIERLSFLSSAMVIMAMTPDYRQSWSMKAVPFRDSRSKEMDCSRHIWKNDLYWIFERPGWCKYLQYMKQRDSEKSRLYSEYWRECY